MNRFALQSITSYKHNGILHTPKDLASIKLTNKRIHQAIF